MITANPCDSKPDVENGTVCDENHVYGQVYKVECDPGYEPAGSPVAECDINGKWKPVTTCLGVCETKDLIQDTVIFIVLNFNLF